MKQIVLAVLLISFGNLFAQQTQKILFVGNSLTFMNDMPSTFEAIANDLENPTEVSQYTPGGVGLAFHSESAELFDMLRKGDWNFVVLQPGTNEGGGPDFGGSTVETTLSKIQIILDSIYAYSPCAQVILYEFSNGIRGNANADYSAYNNSMNVIRDNILAFSEGKHLPMVPAGETLRYCWNTDSLMLWGAYYDVHPNRKGSYMIACAFYASIFQQPSLGTSVIPFGVSDEEAVYFQNIADSIVLQHPTQWHLDWLHRTHFSFTSDNNLSFNFTNLSQNHDSLSWNFGDGTFSNEENPSHTYASYETAHSVSLKTWKGDCMIEKRIDNLATDITEVSNSDFSFEIFPNPCHSFLRIQNANINTRYTVYSSTGKKLFEGTGMQVEVSRLKQGKYLIEIVNGKNRQQFNFVKE